MMASFDICRGKIEGAKDEALLLEINKQLDDTRTDLAETRTLLSKAMANADEVENELRAAEAELAEAATKSGVSVCMLSTFLPLMALVPHCSIEWNCLESILADKSRICN